MQQWGTVPLLDRLGRIVAHALVGVDDWERAASYRWTRNNCGYAKRRDGPHTVLLHRELLGLAPGDGLQADHINGDRLDNRRSNLRVVSHAENGQNAPSQAGSSRYRGVYLRGARWVAQCKLAGRRYYLGTYATEREAASAASDFRLAHMPNTNEGRSCLDL